jgi:beta-lactamase regulating signal transducer with metallopeptidase domain
LIIAAGALAAATSFARASSRYPVLAAGFALTAVSGPVALGIAAVRPAAGAVMPLGAALAHAISVPLLLIIGALGSALLANLLIDLTRLASVKRFARTIGSVRVRGARIAVSPDMYSPAAVGFRHPAILLPDDFRGRVDDTEWNAVIAHESAHLARGDDWAKAVQSVVLCAGWWLPGLWILGRALDLEREVASDECAAATAGPRRYAACLVRLASDAAPGLPAPAFRGVRSQLGMRVERLLGPATIISPLERTARVGLATAATLAVLASACAAVPAFGPPHITSSSHPAQIAVLENR